MKVQKSGSIITVDLHGMRAEDARFRLAHLITQAPPDTTEIVVIHGFNNGHALRDMVRMDFTHPRVKSVLKTLTDGKTRLLLKKQAR